MREFERVAAPVGAGLGRSTCPVHPEFGVKIRARAVAKKARSL